MIKSLVADDDVTSRMLLEGILREYGEVHVAINGRLAVEAVRAAMKADEPYDLICLDILMPEMDGQAVLRQIRIMEEAASTERAKIIMTTVLSDVESVSTAIRGSCDAYIVKPVDKATLLEHLRSLKLIA